MNLNSIKPGHLFRVIGAGDYAGQTFIRLETICKSLKRLDGTANLIYCNRINSASMIPLDPELDVVDFGPAYPLKIVHQIQPERLYYHGIYRGYSEDIAGRFRPDDGYGWQIKDFIPTIVKPGYAQSHKSLTEERDRLQDRLSEIKHELNQLDNPA